MLSTSIQFDFKLDSPPCELEWGAGSGMYSLRFFDNCFWDLSILSSLGTICELLIEGVPQCRQPRILDKLLVAIALRNCWFLALFLLLYSAQMWPSQLFIAQHKIYPGASDYQPELCPSIWKITLQVLICSKRCLHFKVNPKCLSPCLIVICVFISVITRAEFYIFP